MNMSIWLCGLGHLIYCPSEPIQLMKSGFFFVLLKLSHLHQVKYCRDYQQNLFLISIRLFAPFIYLDSQIQVTWLITLLEKIVTKVPVYWKCFSQLNFKDHSTAEIIVHPSVVRRAKPFAKVAVVNMCCHSVLCRADYHLLHLWVTV